MRGMDAKTHKLHLRVVSSRLKDLCSIRIISTPVLCGTRRRYRSTEYTHTHEKWRKLSFKYRVPRFDDTELIIDTSRLFRSYF